MSFPSSAFVFSCADPDVFGLSVQSGGHNIPRVGHNCPWFFKALVSLTGPDLAPYASDTIIALANLRARGYHIARKSAAAERARFLAA